jgi:hypothetical protein
MFLLWISIAGKQKKISLHAFPPFSIPPHGNEREKWPLKCGSSDTGGPIMIIKMSLNGEIRPHTKFVNPTTFLS